MTASHRQQRTDAADAMCSAAFEHAVPDPDVKGIALVAVGGYGRAELAPYSDLDLVLIHADRFDETGDVFEVASQVWYPLWDAGANIDHSVRALSEVTAAAQKDVRVALGLLDARHLAGDPSLTLRLRTSLLAQWRRDARESLPRLRELVSQRGSRVGELAHSSIPDLKESTGGLRDATALNALVATWLVDVPHTDLERCRLQLLDVRDTLHEIAGRSTDRVAPELWAELATGLGVADAAAAQLHVRELGRRITHISRLTWRRVDSVLARPTSRSRGRRPALEPIAPGLAASSGEVVLEQRAKPADDPWLLLRAAAEAAERDLILAPATAARLARECPAIPEPWSAHGRNLLVRLLASGPGLLAVWETLDETGALDTLLPEWERVRLLPHASAVHRFTVDRHLVETCIEASRLIRRVRRPDVLMVAALLHDIGKGGVQDHSQAGEPVAADVARRIGFDAGEVALVAGLVRWHLLLPEVATTRDLEDPASVDYVTARVADPEMLDLLEVVTEADARATAPKAWSTWRAGLVTDLAQRVRATFADVPAQGSALGDPSEDSTVYDDVDIPARLRENADLVDVRLKPSGDGSCVTVTSRDRVGLLAAAAAAFALQRLSVRSARAWTQGEYAVSVWEVDDPQPDAAILRQRLEAILDSRLDPAERLRTIEAVSLEPSVAVRHDASREATVLEVRVDDRRGVVHLVCAALATLTLSVRSAHVTTFGPQAVDVFYVQENGAGALSDERAAEAAHAVRRALGGPVTLDH